MNIGITPPLTLDGFFPGKGPRPRISPGHEESSLWSAAGGGSEGDWYGLQDDQRWGFWSALLVVDEAPFSQYDGLIEHLRKGSTTSNDSRDFVHRAVRNHLESGALREEDLVVVIAGNFGDCFGASFIEISPVKMLMTEK